MIAYLKKILKWGSPNIENKKNQTSLLLVAFIALLEDILFWKKLWLSLSCIFSINLIFFLCLVRQINSVQFIFGLCATILIFDAFEAWLKYKHRSSCLKRLVTHNGTELRTVVAQMKWWMRRKWVEFVYLRETNHSKAFLLVNIFLTILFFVGKLISGYYLMYFLCMFICVSYKVAPLMQRFAWKIQQNAESDGELEGLIPNESEVDIKLLSIEPEMQNIDDRQSLDYWKPEDELIEEASDSSDNSSSLVTNLSMAKMQTLDKDVATSDSSDDEYIPLDQQREQVQSTLEVIEPASTWSSSAYNALYNLTGAVANIMYSTHEDSKRKRVSSIDSSDGFEMIDKNDLT